MEATILIVDDTAENITLLTRILKIRGYEILVANNGVDAVNIAKTSRPDLILLDVSMPVMDGFEACRLLKKDSRTREIPVIFISALDAIEDKVNALRAGGVDYILKPFDYEEVQARVETHLAIRHLRVQLEAANRELALRVDELTRSQEQLGERERKLSAFVSALPNLSFIYDEQGRYLEVFANDVGFLTAEVSALVGRRVEDVLPPKTAALVMDTIRQTIETEAVQVIEYRVPVLAGGERWFEGRLALMEKDEAGHSKVVCIASEISERVQLYQDVQRLADQDPLTGCLNRRHFMTLAELELQQTLRHRRPLSLLMLDIDHFKSFNDLYGHQTGDQVLRSIVDLSQKYLRSTDFLGRYGGEEFILLMPGTPLKGALQSAERLREKIAGMKLKVDGEMLSVTVSMGLASLEKNYDQEQSLDIFIKRADQALYAAKSAGRNCIRTG